MARLGRLVSVMAVLALIGTSCGAGDTSTTSAPVDAAKTSTTSAPVDAATASAAQQISADADACVEYTSTVAAIAALAGSAFDTVVPVFGALSDETVLIALLLDDDLMDTLIDTFESYSDIFDEAERSVPTAPPTWTKVDRHLRNALSTYASTFASLASGFRLMKAGDMDSSIVLIGNAAADLDEATSELSLASDAIPPGGC